MSLYGALFGGVSGLQAQSSAISVISDNIANVNTVGFREAEAQFESLVVGATAGGSFETGGVRGTFRLNVDQQGTLIATSAPTDVAISGNGLFVVNAQPDGTGEPLYTRAGSFRQDANGNLVNSAGFFLQGYELDEEGRLPGEPGNVDTRPFSDLSSLDTVNVLAATGAPVATTEVTLAANLDAAAPIFPGQPGTIDLDINSPNNFGIDAQDILVGDEFGLAPTNSIVRGDQFRVSTGSGFTFDYEYGGFSVGRDIDLAGAANVGDSLVDNTLDTPLAAGDIIFRGTNQFDITIPNHNLITNDTISLNNVLAPLGATPISEFATPLPVERIDANTLRVTVNTPHGGADGAAAGGGAGETINTRQFTGNVFDATSSTQVFFGNIGTAGFTTAALTFNIATPSLGASTFNFSASSPNTQVGQFNNLASLSEAIDNVVGLASRIVEGRLLVSSEDASESVTFTNGDATGDDFNRGIDFVGELGLVDVAASTRRFNNLQGLANIVNNDDGVSAIVTNPLTEAGLQISVDDPLDTIQFADVNDIVGDGTPFNFPAAVGNINIGDGAAVLAGDPVPVRISDATFASTLNVGDELIVANIPAALQAQLTGAGLDPNLLNSAPGFAFQVTEVNAGVDYVFEIPSEFLPAGLGAAVTVDGTGTETISILGETNQGSLTGELGLTDSLLGAPYNPLTPGIGDTGVLGPLYDSSGVVGGNLASGDITPQFSSTVVVFDSLGVGHNVSFSYIKIADNEWQVEVHVVPESDIASTLPDGQIAVGQIQFNGDGTLQSASAALLNPIPINFTNGASQSVVSLDLGTAGPIVGTAGATQFGAADGLRQFADDFAVFGENDANGAPVGELVSVTINDEGQVIASFDNGENRALFQLPVADFSNPNGLRAISGNVFAQTQESGDVILRESGEQGAGTIVSASLEQSNVDLSEQLTDLIVAQRSYQANTRVITTSDELLEQLNNI